MFKLGIIFILLLVASCNQQPVGQFTEVDTDSVDNPTNVQDDGPIQILRTLSWRENLNYSKTLARSQNTNKISYLFGDDLHNYLLNANNFNSKFCMTVQFTDSDPLIKEYRVKLTPSFLVNYSSGIKEYYLRVATSSSTGNDYCNKSVESLQSDGSTILVAPSNPIANSTTDICLTCNGNLTSTNIYIYKVNESLSSLAPISISELKYNDLKLIIEQASTSTDNGTPTSCSNTSCNQDGYDCCINNQCVNNKAQIKDQSLMTPDELSDFSIAESLKAANPNWYLQYPNFYYICPNLVDLGDQDNDNNQDNDNAPNISQRIQDYYCIEELKTYSESDPFHDLPINNNHTYVQCNSTDSSDIMYFESVMSRLYANCGCDDQFVTLQEKVNNCPNYSYTPVFELDIFGNQTTNVLNTQCYAPPVEDNTPVTQIVEVSAKSAPHRFFNTDGIEIDLDKNPQAIANQNQEGSDFLYLDADYIFPQNGSFNMNSLLGQMSVSLSLAVPAKKIKIDNDKQYFLETLTGYYTPCPTCSKDSWSSQLSINPPSGQGYGVQSIGFTTRRDQVGSNTSFANYSDNHFGRACFVPPTMLPFSQRVYSDVKDQRKNRLTTQAALYVNGYQKDWFGFNKGALIGSFDGVTWFAVGNGRIVRSTSEYLYLAINAPFADLALPNNHQVIIQEWDGISTAPKYDFDPSKTLNSPYQNQGATCQENYLCEADSDCITKLGWEYNCQDVTSFRSKWPKFDTTTSSEVANDERASNLYTFLQQGIMPPGSTKRCVYKGAGSICRTDASALDSEDARRKLTCAPNFYCANINTSGVFNKEVARFGAPLQSQVESYNHLYGKDANQLGRPKHYIPNGNGASLPSVAKLAITESVLLIDPTATGKVGLCLPGKALPKYSGSNVVDKKPEDTHDKADPAKRTDYISQVGACNPTIFSREKYVSCPVLDVNGNYVPTSDEYFSANSSQRDDLLKGSALQNSCGFESLSEQATLAIGATESYLKNYSAFSTIEADTLSSGNIIVNPTLAANACLRRAGAVCHTDLDCSPNSLHSDVIDIINPEFFGNDAERAYWSENLICAQGTKEPSLGESNFNTYDITNNRCCREIGSSITLHTEKSSDIDVNPRTFASIAPNNPTRYSRYSILGELVDSITPGVNDEQFVSPSASTDLSDATNITTKYQWKTISAAASQTCCGGGFIRKFADGTNNWNINRLNLDISNFSCLNSKTPLLNVDPLGAAQIDSSVNYYSKLDGDRGSYCSDVNRVNGNCSDMSFPSLDFTNNTKPSVNENNAISAVSTYTDAENGISEWNDANNEFSFYLPTSALTESSQSSTHAFMDWRDDSDSSSYNKKILINIPTYIPLNSIGIIEIYDVEDNDYRPCTELSWQVEFENTIGQDDPPTIPVATQCYYSIDPTSRRAIVAYEEDLESTYQHFHFAKIQYEAPGSKLWEASRAPANPRDNGINEQDIVHRRSSSPGEAIYYLQKLAKLELIGIPQVGFEPIYCNDNYQKVVPGILNETYNTVNKLIDAKNDPLDKKVYQDTDLETPWTTNADITAVNQKIAITKDALVHQEIFSSEEMMCCTPVGKEAQSSSQCCSGLAVADEQDGNTLKCKIPTGVNLNVYFNRFVSNEATNEDSGSAVLTEADFDPKTGAPNDDATTITKIVQLGVDFCEGGSTRRGGAFGNFAPQPANGNSADKVFNIVDSFSDNGNNNNETRGAADFGAGYRWNHNVYCAPGDGN